ncbi:hypothetical protein, partial [Auraticoccus cholistanensis]|uniref:hypothetical protein n=1 Tax=Auraticoccus cholistanensis TaxID=2656650 RepID=UPI0018D27221
DAGEVTNTATALATGPGGAVVVSEEDDALLPLPADPGIALVKTVTPTEGTAAGDQVTYSF